MKKMYVVAIFMGISSLAGCSASTPPPKSEVSQQKTKTMVVFGQDGRADVKMTVDSLISYCDEWANVYEMRLGKVYNEGYSECIDLTTKMINDRSNAVKKESMSKNFPFEGKQ